MTDDTSTLWMIFVLFVCGAAVLGALMPTIGTVWIAGVTYPLMVVLTLIGFDILIHHDQVDLETVAIVGAASLVMAVPVTLLAHYMDRILLRGAKFPNGDRWNVIGADHVPARRALAATDRREDVDAQGGEVPTAMASASSRSADNFLVASKTD